MQKLRKRRKDAHACENCYFFQQLAGSCWCENESELTEVQYSKFFENCKTGCPGFFRKEEEKR